MARFEVLKAYLHHGVAAANRPFAAITPEVRGCGDTR
jgi:hypothetical protein